MGREIKRVPARFDWPIGQVWEGYKTEPSEDPPPGDWYQLWETVSEGSPVSPPFATAEELAEWMSKERCTVQGPVPYADALAWILGPGFAPTMILQNGQQVNPYKKDQP